MSRNAAQRHASTAPVSILDCLDDPRLLGSGFTGSTWNTWRAILAAAFGLPMTAEQHETFARLSGDRALPAQRVRELWAVAGRRSGKSRVAAGVAVALATVIAEAEGILARLAHGERGVVGIIACDRAQARLILT